MLVNDRSVSVLENYDFEVIRTQKSRNAILCETNKGWYILRDSGKTALLVRNNFCIQKKARCFAAIRSRTDAL